jgi:hypothetical protein
MSLRGTCGIRLLLPALTGAAAAFLLVLAAPPADAEAVRAGCGAVVEPNCRTHMMVGKSDLGGTGAGTTASVEGAVAGMLKQAEEIEAELAQMPGDEGLLAKLTRTRISAADAMITNGAGESKSGADEVKRQFALAGVAWSEYLKVTKRPSVSLAILVAPGLFQLAELSSDSQGALKSVKAAVVAQKIVVEGRPGKNSWSTLAFYELFAQDHKAADESIERAISYVKTEYERGSIEKRFKEVERAARRFGRRLKAR